MQVAPLKTDSTTTRQRRSQLTNVACGECQRRKLKCDGRRPCCERCARTNNPRTCVYDSAQGITRRSALKQKNEQLFTQLGHNEHLIQLLRNNGNEAAINIILRLRDGQEVASIIDSTTNRQSPVLSDTESSSSLGSTALHTRQFSHFKSSNDTDSKLSASTFHIDGSAIAPSHDKMTLMEKMLLGDNREEPRSFGTAKDSMFSSNNNERLSGETSFRTTMLQLQKIRQRLLVSDSQLHQYGNMPSRHTASRLINASIQSTPALFLCWNLSQAEAVIGSVYDESHTSSFIELAEFFVLIMGGADYDAGLVSEDENAIYCAFGITYFLASAKIDCLSTMRVLLCLVLFLLSQKCNAVEHLLPGAVYVGRLAITKLRASKADLERSDYWESVFNSLHLIESWLRITSNHYADFRAQRELSTLPGINIISPSINEAIHVQASKVGSIALTLQQSFATEAFDKATLLTISKDTLLNWHETLPDELKLTGFISGRNENYTRQQKQGILMVHMMYSRVVAILQQQVISSTLSAHQTSPQPQRRLSGQTAACLNERDESSRRLAQVINLMGIDGVFNRRCWFTIDMCFSTACVLVSALSHKLLFRHPAGIEDDLRLTHICIAILEYCSTVDELAMRHVSLLQPVYHDLQLLHDECYLDSKNSVDRVLADTKTALEFQDYMFPPNVHFRAEAVSVARRASELLTNSFTKEGLVV